MKIMQKTSDNLNEIVKKVVAVLLVLITVIITIQVFYRHVLKDSLTWSEETARYIFIWLIMLGSSIGVKEGGHIAITIIKDKLKGRKKLVLDIIINLMIAFFALVLLVAGIRISLSVTGQLSPGIRLSMFWVYISVPISGFIILIHTLNDVFNSIKNF